MQGNLLRLSIESHVLNLSHSCSLILVNHHLGRIRDCPSRSGLDLTSEESELVHWVLTVRATNAFSDGTVVGKKYDQVWKSV